MRRQRPTPQFMQHRAARKSGFGDPRRKWQLTFMPHEFGHEADQSLLRYYDTLTPFIARAAMIALSEPDRFLPQ